MPKVTPRALKALAVFQTSAAQFLKVDCPRSLLPVRLETCPIRTATAGPGGTGGKMNTRLLEKSLIQFAPVSLKSSSSETDSSTEEGQKQVSATVCLFSIRVQLKVMSAAACFLPLCDRSRWCHFTADLLSVQLKQHKTRRQMSSCLLVTGVSRPPTVVYVCL